MIAVIREEAHFVRKYDCRVTFVLNANVVSSSLRSSSNLTCNLLLPGDLSGYRLHGVVNRAYP